MRTIEIKEEGKIHEFWMVYISSGMAPRQTHPTYEEAQVEARRLCEKEHSDAYILKAVGGYEFCQGFAEIKVADVPVKCEEE